LNREEIEVNKWKGADDNVEHLICRKVLRGTFKEGYLVASSSELTLGKLTPGPAEDALRQKLLTEAHTLGLPVLPGDIHFTRTPQALEVRIRYIVHQSLGLYHVDLHFHPSARTALR
jgi:hypothetical protein